MIDKVKHADRYIHEVTLWAQSHSTIVALALVGSHARGEARPDSDIDFVLICDDTSHLLDNFSWIERFGQVKSHKVENWGIVTSLRVIYIDGQEIEFGIAPIKWADIPVDEGTYQVVVDGMIILEDKQGILRKLKNAFTDVKTE